LWTELTLPNAIRAAAKAGFDAVECHWPYDTPASEIRAAGGREVNLRSLQPLALYAANSIFVEGYLTTPGQQAQESQQMIEDMGFEMESYEVQAQPA